MAIPKPSEARIVIEHHENGKSRLLIDGMPLPGLVSFGISQEKGLRAELSLMVIGVGYRVEQIPPKSEE